MSNNSSPAANCTLETCPLSEAYVNYDPSLVANAIYVAVFGAVLVAQCYQAYYFKAWTYSISMILGLSGEVIGYVARIQMHFNPFLANPFLMYLICLTIAPVFFSAAIYLCLSRIVVIYGVENSRFRPKTYTVLFICCDFISLVLQAAGGAIADTSSTNVPLQNTGVHIMVAGLAFQVASLLLFALLCIEYGLRVRKHVGKTMTEYSHISNTTRFRLFLYGLAFATISIIARSGYRLAELEGGFSSALANNEVLLMVFDGAMMALTCLTLTIFHAGLAMEGNWSNTSTKLRAPFLASIGKKQTA